MSEEKDGISQRIDWILKQESLSSYKAAEMMQENTGFSVSPQNVDYMRKNESFRSERLIAFIIVFGGKYSAEWILTGVGEVYRSPEAEALLKARNEIDELQKALKSQQHALSLEELDELRIENVELKEQLNKLNFQLSDMKIVQERYQMYKEQNELLKEQIRLMKQLSSQV
jgi:hypothetical protein